mgnify:CR=1 FL=1
MRDEKFWERSRFNGAALVSLLFPNHVFYQEEVYW